MLHIHLLMSELAENQSIKRKGFTIVRSEPFYQSITKILCYEFKRK